MNIILDVYVIKNRNYIYLTLLKKIELFSGYNKKIYLQQNYVIYFF